MMFIYFEPLQKKWSHRRAGKTFVWGKNQQPLTTRPFLPAVAFRVRSAKNRIGPLVGIWTSPGKSSFAGNRAAFYRLHQALQTVGGIAFVFTHEGFNADSVTGCVYNARDECWSETVMPLPDVVYNRLPFREDEIGPAYDRLVNRFAKCGIPFFNRRFLDKWTIHDTLTRDPELQKHLPVTLHADVILLQSALLHWPSVMIKPVDGHQGIGMFTIEKSEQGAFVVQTHEQTEHFMTFQALGERFEQLTNDRAYVIQPRIPLDTHEKRPYDFRVLMQKLNGSWQLTGIGARVAGEKAITTHVPRGGSRLAIDKLSPPVNLSAVESICSRAAERLASEIDPLYELSFDVGRDWSGHLWLFEANAKPMVFDEKEIEAKRMRTLIAIMDRLSGFQ
ncbi:MAG TPA: YheC/YheD family protein [Bacillales bacterium]|nr:YheC/YheD family protein [Bacillales bacterium]